jgi:hypothetical protein
VVVTGLVMVASTETVGLPTTFYRESLAFLVRTSDSSTRGLLTYIPYAQFQAMFNLPLSIGYPSTGTPTNYSIFNIHNDGKVSLRPIPDAATASDSTLTVHYYRRTPLVSEQDPLLVPQEVEVSLMYGAQKRMATHLKGAADPDVRALDAMESRALERLKAVDKRHPDERARFKLVDAVPSAHGELGTIYIKI